MKDTFKLYSEETQGLSKQLNILTSFDLTKMKNEFDQIKGKLT